MSKNKSGQTQHSSVLTSSQSVNTTTLNAPGIKTMDQFCLKSAQTVNQMKRSMNVDTINLNQYETLLTEKIAMLSRFLGFRLEDDLRGVANDVFDENELSYDVQSRLNQREYMSKLNNNNCLFLPSKEAIKLSITSMYKYNVRKLKRELLLKQLKYEELQNFLIYYRNKDIENEIGELKIKIKNFESQLYNLKDHKEERLERVKSQNILSKPKNVEDEVNSLIKEMEIKNDEVKHIRTHINEQIS